MCCLECFEKVAIILANSNQFGFAVKIEPSFVM